MSSGEFGGSETSDKAAVQVLMTGDPHIHSTFSDGKLDAPELLLLSASRCLDFMGVADHNTTAGAIAARDVWTNGLAGARPFLAQEVSSEERLHLLIYGLEGTLGAVRFPGLPDLLNRVNREGGATVLAHPWTILDHPRARRMVAELIASGLIHGIEVASAALFYEEFAHWRQALVWYGEMRSLWRLAALGGTDWHDHGQGLAFGLGRTLFWGSSCSDTEFVQAIRRGETAASLHLPSLIEHGLLERVYRETQSLWPWPWDGLLGEDRILARIRQEQGRLAAAIETQVGPARGLARNLLACGSFSAAAYALGTTAAM